MNYGRIVILAGGPSSEREISLKSGRAIFEALSKKGHDAELLDADTNFLGRLLAKKPDIVFLALHGNFGEDGTVQKMLEEAGIPYTGSGVLSSKLAMDKIASKEIFAKNGLNTPRYKIISKKSCKPSEILDNFKAPFVIKPRSEGSSIGFTIVREKSHLQAALEEAFRYGESALAEEYIDGRELTVGILEERALPVIEILTKEKVYDYSAKYRDTETRYIVPADLKKHKSQRVRDLGLRAHTLLGCRDLSRVDMRMDEKGNIFVLEVNTIPGMTERSLLPKAASAIGIDFGKLCAKLAGFAHGRKGGIDGEKQNR